MANIVVFGKPRAFESYEYVFDGDNQSVENVHREPILKPKRYDEAILHYFARDGYAGLEYYTRAKGFESERDGIVFGVSMKSSSDFNISKTIFKLLQPFWIDFASALLDDNNRFVEDSIINRLKCTKWSQSEIDTIRSTSLSIPIQSPTKGMLLLVSPQLDDIKLVEHEIKEYGDVYLSGNIDIFKDPINEIVLKEADNQIYQIQDGSIVPFATSTQQDPQPGPVIVSIQRVFNRIAKLPVWGNNQDTNVQNKKIKHRRIIRAIASVTAIGLALFIIYHFWHDNSNIADNKLSEVQVTTDTVNNKDTSDSTDVQDTVAVQPQIHPTSVTLASYSAPIKQSWNLNPQIYPENCSSVASDITFTVSNESLVHIDTEKYRIVVDQRPKKETIVTVQAYINGVLLGEKDYTIAQEAYTPAISGKHIPYWKGKPRTKNDYLKNLRDMLKKNPKSVIEECQKIINGDYGDEYKLDAEAIKLRDEAKKIVDTQIEPAF